MPFAYSCTLSSQIYTQNVTFFSRIQGTIRPNPNLNAELAARQLNASFQGIKSDAVTIINILTTHSNHQRQKIKRHYRILYVKVSTQNRFVKLRAFLYLEIRDEKLFYLESERVIRSDRTFPSSSYVSDWPSP
jgi:hypothetical protein